MLAVNKLTLCSFTIANFCSVIMHVNTNIRYNLLTANILYLYQLYRNRVVVVISLRLYEGVSQSVGCQYIGV